MIEYAVGLTQHPSHPWRQPQSAQLRTESSVVGWTTDLLNATQTRGGEFLRLAVAALQIAWNEIFADEVQKPRLPNALP